ncbi:MAG: hypothetical protein ACT7A5_30025 [Ferrovibrionaceae bacterium]
MISSIATVSGYGYTQVPATALGNASARTPETAATGETASNVLPRNLPFLPTRIAFDSDINRFVLQFRNTKDGEITGQIPAGKSSWAYREAQLLRGEKADQADKSDKSEVKLPGDKSNADPVTASGEDKAPAPVVIGAGSDSGGPDKGVATIGSGGFGGSTAAPSAVSSYAPPAPATQSSGRGTTA